MRKIQYTQPRTEIVPLQTPSALLSTSGGRTTPIVDGESQTKAW